MCGGRRPSPPPPPPPAPVIDNSAFERQMEENNRRLAEAEARANAQREADIKRQQDQFNKTYVQQQQQFDSSMAAQNAALERQMEAQREAQRKAEEAALRSQVPQMTSNDSNARRVKSKTSSRETARTAALGTSQLRVPLSIGSTTGGGSPVKLNIGS